MEILMSKLTQASFMYEENMIYIINKYIIKI